MQVLIILLVVIFAISSISRRAKNASEHRPGQTEKPRTSPGPRYETWRNAFPDEMRESEDEREPRNYAPNQKTAPSGDRMTHSRQDGYSNSTLETKSYSGEFSESSFPEGNFPEGKSLWKSQANETYEGSYVAGSFGQPNLDESKKQTGAHGSQREQAASGFRASKRCAYKREKDPSQLRNAVIMSEILDRPVSLRRRAYRR